MSESSVFPSQPPAPSSYPTPIDRWRWLLSGIIAILGGYLTLLSLTGGFVNVFAGVLPDPAINALLIAELVFAVAVTALGYFFVPAPLSRRLIAKVVYVVGIVILVILMALRISTGFGGMALGVTLANPAFMVLLLGGFGWLLACGVAPVRYLVLLVALVVMPIWYWFALAGITTVIATIVQFAVCGVAAVIILLVSRPPIPKPIIGIAEQPA
jgi:hypothetical protein